MLTLLDLEGGGWSLDFPQGREPGLLFGLMREGDLIGGGGGIWEAVEGRRQKSLINK